MLSRCNSLKTQFACHLRFILHGMQVCLKGRLLWEYCIIPKEKGDALVSVQLFWYTCKTLVVLTTVLSSTCSTLGFCWTCCSFLLCALSVPVFLHHLLQGLLYIQYTCYIVHPIKLPLSLLISLNDQCINNINT